MIKNQDDLDLYETYNKIYIPDGNINQNWKYNFNGDYIVIRTNQNCTTNYNTTYCDCKTYNYKNNVLSTIYNCNYSSDSTQSIAYTSLSSDINDSAYIRERFIQDKSILLVMIIVGVLIAILLTRRGAYR